MARIRTIKPEFFTSDDVTALSMPARLLYIALWCEADRRGRMEWKPSTFKRRYFPDDTVDIHALCQELLDRGVVELYQDGDLAWIPRFEAHQHVNPREAESRLADPKEAATVADVPKKPVQQVAEVAPGAVAAAVESVPTVTDSPDLLKKEADSRVSDASARVSDAQVGREGKGRERKGKEHIPLSDDRGSARGVRATRIPADFSPSPEPELEQVLRLNGLDPRAELGRFRDHWSAMPPGKDSTKADWQATWRNWLRKAVQFARPGSAGLRPVGSGGGGSATGETPFQRRLRERYEEATGRRSQSGSPIGVVVDVGPAAVIPLAAVGVA